MYVRSTDLQSGSMPSFVTFFLHFLLLNTSSSVSGFASLPQLKLTSPLENFQEINVKAVPHSCPPENKEDIEIVDRVSHLLEDAFKFKYCVFEKPVTSQDDLKCKTEIKPIFLPQKNENKEMINCGTETSPNRYTYSFGFYLCGNTDQLQKFRRSYTLQLRKPKERYRVEIESIYDVCFDTSKNQTISTSHLIMKPALFANTNLENEYLDNDEISTDSFDLKHTRFLNLKTTYKLESQRNSKHGMVPHPLVPPEHFAFAIWKKTTDHFINMAPLRKTLVPIMKAIDNGLKSAQMKLYSKNPKSYDKLIIYTKVENVVQITRINSKGTTTQTYVPQNESVFRPNIWYKFIYIKKRRKGVLILVQNTPSNIPKEDCFQVTWEFETWIKNAAVDQSRSINKHELQFAQGCQTSREEIAQLFSIQVEIDDVLNLDQI